MRRIRGGGPRRRGGAAGAGPNIYNFYNGRDSGAQSSSGMYTPCFSACCAHRHDCVRVLLALGGTPDHSTSTDSRYKCTCPGDIARR